MQRNAPDPFYDLDFDPFEEDNKAMFTSSNIFEDGDRDFEEIATILNAQKYHDPIIALRAMLNDHPHITPKERAKIEPKKTFFHTLDAEKLLLEEKTHEAQKKIKSHLISKRNTIKKIYKEMKAQDKNVPNNPFFVEYLLLDMAGIAKCSKEYDDFKDIHYHTLVMCLVKFISSYTRLGLHHCTRFSSIQLAFRNYLYEKIPQKDNALEKEMKCPVDATSTPAMVTIDEQLSILERLNRILNTILLQLQSCARHMMRPSLFRATQPLPSDAKVTIDSKGISL